MIEVRSLKGLTSDSRKVKQGFLFAALPGAKADGAAFIADAIKNGASCILAGKDITAADISVPLVQVDNPRREFALLAAEFYGAQPETMVAVTGTNGKTSTAVFTQQIWEALGQKAVSIGTLGVHGAGLDKEGTHTTPDPAALHELLAELSDAGVNRAVMEASSHGLDQHRLDGVNLKAAGFTNLTRDHLDYHGTMEAYKAAKLRLFTEVLEENGLAVLNADVPEFDEFSTAALKAGRQVMSYGHNGAELQILEMNPVAEGLAVSLKLFGHQHDFTLPLIGAFQLYNALCAVGIAMAPEEAAISALKFIKGVPGRMQGVGGHPAGAGVYVDYAHTPDALENVLKAARPHTEGKLICLMGCGGDRDKGKRPVMGKAACDLADHVIVTDDNPRSEDPAAIRADVLAGCHGDYEEVGGRREAIRHAVKILQAGDVLIIAGKGHEQGQIFKDHTEPFDDVSESQKALEEL
ncbi:MAG: UDP-N-acetylmuramoyl-L-alanyl-D-glutamate--2,6-diaminopimelate ligase [Alphaproteobacteria bacterium]|nr:UDP-N-acetylmuramoyl-L-alanyl-D-glutamate--2,6-diaminopimelate ligase [Alphaproteobacteria bacterium]MCD8525611.1 UDP-N-acetylmuramoyl-L-alanyl-D-glutamate--2,6-diaminopimelate ligase [Alphaproteobacteria bacterium]